MYKKMLFRISHYKFNSTCSYFHSTRLKKGIINQSLKLNCIFLPKVYFAKLISVEEASSITVTEIKKFLNQNNIGFEQGYTCFILNCPFCTHAVKLDKRALFCINMTTGMFVCHSCKRSGSWKTFQDYFEIVQSQKKQGKLKFDLPEIDNEYLEKQEMSKHGNYLWSLTLPIDTLASSEFDQLAQKFKLEGLKIESFKKYSIHIDQDKNYFAIPWYSLDGSVIGIKKVSLNVDREFHEDCYPRPEFGSLFGWNTITKNHQEVVLTINEFHALAVNQETRIPSLSLPKGTSVLPQEALPLLEQFKKIILWFGNDVIAWETAKKFAKKLNEKRCYFIRPKDDQPNALKALQLELNLTFILKNATPISHRSITSFRSLRQDVAAELSHTEQVAGTKWKRFPILNKLLKGHRRGELTIFTGPTGSGKTTFMSEYSLDLCVQGVNTLWGSFEIRNVRLAKMMLIQFAQMSLEKNLLQYDFWADSFEQLPMYFMTFHGQESIRSVTDAMSHAVYVHDIEHVIVDNLQFMMGTNFDSPTERFWKQDIIIATFRKFATTTNCHVTLVMHPRKEKDSDDLQTSSIFGGAKAAQEADNVLILQDKRLSSLRGRKYLQVTKNRFDGDIGIMPLDFDRETLSFAVKKAKKVSEKNTSETTKQTEETMVPATGNEIVN